MTGKPRGLALVRPAGLGVLLLLSSCQSGTTEEDDAAQARHVVTVTLTESRRQEVVEELHSVGQLVSKNTPRLAAEINARVVAIGVDDGDAVEQGQELVRLDTTVLELSRREASAEIQRLQAGIANEQRRVERYRELKQSNVMPQERLDDAEARLAEYRAGMAAAQARLAVVEDSLGKARLLSPVNGVVQQRHVSVGDYVKVGTPLVTLTDTESLRAELPFPETVGARLRVGQALALESPLAPGVMVDSTVGRIRPQLGAMNRSLIAIADVTNPGPWRPEATVEGRVLVDRRPGAVVVPVIAVVRRPAGEVVYRVGDGDTVRQQTVTTGLRLDGRVEILDGLEAGARIVEEGASYLTDGARIEVAEAQP